MVMPPGPAGLKFWTLPLPVYSDTIGEVYGTLAAFEASALAPTADSDVPFYTADNDIITADAENPGDRPAFTGTVAAAADITGTLAATEAADVSAITGLTAVLGTVGAIEAGGSPVWDAATAVAVTLSGGNLVATNTGTTSANQGARVSDANALSSGKFYFEITSTVVNTGPNTALGICTTTSTYSNLGNTVAPGVVGNTTLRNTGNIWTNGVNTGVTISNYGLAGQVVSVAVDLDNRQIWFRRQANNWNNSGTANPATNTGGFAIPAGTMVPFCVFGGSGGVVGSAVTANFGASAFSGAVPAGFTAGWGTSADAAAFNGLVGLTGTLAVTEATVDTPAFTGQVRWLGVLAATEASDTPSFTGTVLISGTLARTEGADTSLFTGTVAFPVRTGTLAVTEGAADTFAAAGTVANLRIGILAAPEGVELTADSTLYTADNDSVRINSYFSDEAASFAGYSPSFGVVAATEARDVSAIAGEVFDAVTRIGELDANEDHFPAGMYPTADSAIYTADSTVLTADTALFAGDAAAFTGLADAFVFGSLWAHEDRHITADSIDYTADSTLLTADLEVPSGDTALFEGSVPIIEVAGALAAQEGADEVAAFAGEAISPPIEIGEADQALKNEVQRVLRLAGKGGRVTRLEGEVLGADELQNLDPEVISLVAEQERIMRLGA